MSLIRIPATIEAGQEFSDEIPLENGYVPVALSMPDAWTAANITLQVKDIDGNWQDVHDEGGTEVTITVDTDQWVLLTPLTEFQGLANIRLRSGTSSAAVNQAADRVIGVALRVV